MLYKNLFSIYYRPSALYLSFTFLFSYFSGDASNSTLPQQSPSSAMTAPDKIKAPSGSARDGESSYKGSQLTQNLNSCIQNTNNRNNNISQNTADCNGSSKSGDQYQKNIANAGLSPYAHHSIANDHQAMPRNRSSSPTNASHFADGSGVLADVPPARPSKRQYIQKSK